MRLYHSPASPFVRKVMVTLIETDQLDDVEIVPVSITPVAGSDLLASENPLGKIPTLARDDGPALFDSRVICAFLNARAGTRLYPDNRIWEVRTLEALADGLMDAAVLMVYEGRVRPEELHYAPWIDAQWGKASRALDVLENRWISHLKGPLDAGQVATGCALGYLDFRHGDRNWREGRPALAEWEAGFAARASMTQTVPTA